MQLVFLLFLVCGVAFAQSSPPTITGISPASASPGTSITITGTNFGATQGSSTVAFNDGQLVATPTSWSDTQIKVTVPTGTNSGEIFVSIGGDTILPLQNPSFEVANPITTSCGTNCFYNSGPIPSWTTVSGSVGSWQPNSSILNLPLPDGGSILAYNGGGTLSQTLTGVSLQPNTTYKLSIDVGHRADGYVTNYTVSLLAGTTTLNSITGSNGTITAGSFADEFLTYTTGSSVTSGNLTVQLTSSGSQSEFDAIRLTTGTTTNESTTCRYFVVPPAPPLQGWLDQDIGSVGAAGSTTYANRTFTLNGSGYVGNTSDAFQFAYQPLSGDGTIVARVVSTTNSSTQAGVMIRETLDPGSTNMFAADYSFSIYDFYRTTTGGNTSSTNNGGASQPYWVKLVRSGNVFTGYASSDGVNWTQVGSSQTIAMAQNVYVGLAVASGSSNLSTAAFDYVSISTPTNPAPVITSVSATTGQVGSAVTIYGSGFGSSQGNSVVSLAGSPVTINSWSDSTITITIPSGATSGYLAVTVAPGMNTSNPVDFTITANPLPTAWLDQDVGSVGTAGNATFANGTFTLNGSGFTNGTPDSFHFAYQALSGNGTIVARIVNATNSTTQAGVMIRESLSAGAKSMFVGYFAGEINNFYRLTTSGSTGSANNGNGAFLPYWVKVVRTGNVFAGYASSDGVNWWQVGASQTIGMATNVYVGLAVASNGPNLNQSTFDNVSISTPTAPAPQITAVSATTGAIGGSVTIYGSGFGSLQGNSFVYLAGSPVTVNSWNGSTITITIPSGATSGYLAVTVAPGMNTSNPVDFTVTANPLPPGWLDQDIGVVSTAGNASYLNGTFTVNGAGYGLGGTADTFHFVYQPLSGDGTIIARVVSISNAPAQIGVMIRETLDTGADGVSLGQYLNTMQNFSRPFAGASASTSNTGSLSFPFWMKIVRSGNNLNAFAAQDGIAWQPVGGASLIAMAQNVYIGFGVSSTHPSALYSATFDSVSISTPTAPSPVITSVSATTGAIGSQISITGQNFGSSQGNSVVVLNGAPVTINSWSGTSISITIPTGATSGPLNVLVAPSMNSSNSIGFTVTSQPLPSGWFDADIGVVGLKGSSSYASGVFTLQAGGSSFGTSADPFHFVYQPLSTDGTIVARVASATGSTSFGGVVVRETLDASAASVSSIYSNYFQDTLAYFRTFYGVPATSAVGPGGTLPGWMKVVRASNTFSAYASIDGSTWTQIGTTQTLMTGQTVYVGLGATNGNASTLATVTFDNVSVTLGGSLANPQITGISPTAGYYGSTVTVSGSGFGATPGTSTVYFNGQPATTTNWSDSQITAVVPQDAITGPVSIVVGNITGQGPTFTVQLTSSLTDSLGNQSTYVAQPYGGLWSFTDLQGSGCSSCSARGNVHNQYDSSGNPVFVTDALGYVTSNLFDSSNNLTTQSRQASPTTTATTKYTYNGSGEVLTVTDALGNVTTNAYDSHGNLTSVTTPAPNGNTAASVTQFTYNSLGELTQITDPLNNVTTLTYTTAGLVQTITDAQNNVTTYGYDAHGNRTSVTDALNHQTTFAYDAMDRLKTITYPDTTTTGFTYDSRGRRTSVTDQNGKTTTYAYDDADRLTSVTDTANNVTSYGYDTESNLTSITDPNGHSTDFTYDAYGRLTQTNFPSSLIETYAYDANNNVTRKTDRKNQTILYVYDALNRLVKKQYPDSTEVDYVYDLVGKIQSVNDPTGTYAFAYDNMGRLIGTTTNYNFLTSRSFTTSYTYDAVSNRTGFTDPESGSTSYAYDTLNRLQTLTPPAAFTASGNFGFSYDALSRRTQMTRPNNVTTNYTYDNLSHLLSVLHQVPGSTIDGATYTLDNAGNRKSKVDQLANVTSNYAYDALYRLTGVTQGTTTTESYTYDPVGNRTASLGVSSYTTDVSNQLTAKTGVTYTYDNNGSTTSKTDSIGITNYTWDYDNRLTTVTLPGSGGTVSFKYDPFGRRIYKSSSGGTSLYAYDGIGLIEETNAVGSAVARYALGLNLDEPLAMLHSGATSYYQADGLNSVTSLSNAVGSIANTYTYDSFGNLTASTGSLMDSLHYTGREYDSETGLYNMRARYFDASTGRFLNEDPIGFSGGLNFYSYVDGDPTSLVDPLGLWGQGTGTAPAPIKAPPPPPTQAPPTTPASPVTDPPPPTSSIGQAVGDFMNGLADAIGGAATLILLSPVNAGDPSLDYRPDPGQHHTDPAPDPGPAPKSTPPCKTNRRNCDPRYRDEQNFCREEYAHYPNLLRPCLERARWRWNNCKRGLPDPGPLDPMDPKWAVD